jgi:cob(I)alamin adenosyltransferase
MVHLSRLYTGVGDAGSTHLADGSKAPKHCHRVASYGTVDEANSVLGLLRTEALPDDMVTELQRIQNDLFDLGSDLSTRPGTKAEKHIPRITDGQVKRLEAVIDGATEQLEPLKSFILPGGTKAAAWCHMGRTVVRRAEREAWAAVEEEGAEAFNSNALVYLNRLSDLLFAWSRLLNQGNDILWVPGGADAAGSEGEG